ncbi:hypothetical protein AMS68_003430 [Peltaster fructicola]|uniref:BZIP transcription factor n=1 Tax=Peltaster fructicola TaxID=286661 RepID=A0A6H0XT67_9PEZI|nr:hypothetical protein AMS68_003430 [Peltaster fructicola]
MASDSTPVRAFATPTGPGISTSTADSSAAVSPSEEIDNAMDSSKRLSVRPKLGSRKSSGTMIVTRGDPEPLEQELDDDDVRAMSPRRNSAEVQKLSDEARRDLIEQAKLLQTSLQAIVERVETVREEHEKLEGGNKFLQSYIGELMQTSRITSTAPHKSKSSGRTTK